MKTTLFSLLMSATLTVAAPVSQVDDERVGTYLPGVGPAPSFRGNAC